MRKILSIMLLVLLPLGVAAQKPLDEVARIKADDDYIWGEGRGDTDAKATQSALNDLISKTAQGRFLTNSDVLFQAYYFDDKKEW